MVEEKGFELGGLQQHEARAKQRRASAADAEVCRERAGGAASADAQGGAGEEEKRSDLAALKVPAPWKGGGSSQRWRPIGDLPAPTTGQAAKNAVFCSSHEEFRTNIF